MMLTAMNKERGAMTPIRAIAAAIVGLMLAAGANAPASAQSYPTRPIRVIVPTPAGGPVDAMARVFTNYFAKDIGQSVVIDNRPGAGNTIGSKEAAMATPDGYTLLYSSVSGLIIAPFLHKNAGYDPITSYQPVALVAEASNIILVVNPTVPARSVAELVAYAKANPGKVNFSSGGIGVIPHLVGELFKSRAGLNIVHVPYKGGGPSINGVLAGDVQMTFEGSSVLLPLINAGKLRALAVTSAKRLPQLPDVPTMVESGYPDFIVRSWHGLLAPAKTPAAVIATLNKHVNSTVGVPEFKTAVQRVNSETLGGTPQDFTATMKADIAKWGPIVKSLGLKG